MFFPSPPPPSTSSSPLPPQPRYRHHHHHHLWKLPKMAENYSNLPTSLSSSSPAPPPQRKSARLRLPPSVEELATTLPTPIEPGIPDLVFPYHISTIRSELTKLRSFATGLQSYCMAIIPDAREKAELGDPPSLKSGWVRDKYFRDTMRLESLLRLWVTTFPALGIYVYDFIPINIIGWMFTAVDDETAYNNIIVSRTRLLLSLEVFLRSTIPLYLLKILVYFQIRFVGEKGMFGLIPKGQLVQCCEEVLQTCELVEKSHTMKVLEADAINNIKDIKWWVSRLKRDPETGCFLPSEPFRPDGAKASTYEEINNAQEETGKNEKTVTQNNQTAGKAGRFDKMPVNVKFRILNAKKIRSSNPEDPVSLDTTIKASTINGIDATYSTKGSQNMGDTDITDMANKWNKFRGLPKSISRSFPAEEMNGVFQNMDLDLNKIICSIKPREYEDVDMETEIARSDEMELDNGSPRQADAEKSDSNGTDIELEDKTDELWTPQGIKNARVSQIASSGSTVERTKKRLPTGPPEVEDEPIALETGPSGISTPGSTFSSVHSFDKSGSASPYKKRKLDDIPEDN
ncbi:hypothetical protein TWF506_008041 [Arthrobotrys conoides]|uniref:Uncharacterized protein n=1 Tax=Arthrobotrys conoides TaxID=74498 RepID=A0AAN8RRL8_9PEZI